MRLLLAAALSAFAQQALQQNVVQAPKNAQIDMEAHLRLTMEAAKHREERRVPEEEFPTKLPPASLNLSTYTTLYIYGYRKVYELGPTVDLKDSKLPFEGTKKD